MKIIADDLSEEKRLDAYIRDYMQDISRSKITEGIKSGQIKVNYSVQKPSYTVKDGDLIEINISASLPVIEPEDIPIDIVWEDENMLVINKPSGMLTHPTTIETKGTLVNALLFRYGQNLSDINGEFRRGIVHRLDRNTSGLLMIAKNNDTHIWLTDNMKQGNIDKRYVTVVKGVVDKNDFIINKPIGRNPNQPHKMAVREDGKDSISEVKVLERYKNATLCEIHLITGRTHQIRVHMSSIGHPVFNDTLYGFGKMKIQTQEQVLQSYKLTFPKPLSNGIISLEIPYDEKVQKVINFCKKN